MLIAIVIISAIAFGIICAEFCGRIARAKGFDQSNWYMTGLLIGPLALIAAAGLPDLKMQRYMRALVDHYGAQADEAETASSDNGFTTMQVFSVEEVWEKTMSALGAAIASQADIGQSKVSRNEVLVRNKDGKLLARATSSGNVSGPKRWILRYVTTGQ